MQLKVAMKTRRSRDGSCVGNYSDKSAVCKLCRVRDICINTFLGRNCYTINPRNYCGTISLDTVKGIICGINIIDESLKEVTANEDRSCRKCRWLKRSIHGYQFNQCRHDGMWGSAYCDSERNHNYDSNYNKCGIEGRLWEAIPPTWLDKLMEKISHHVRGPKEQRVERVQQKNIWDILKEAVKGPQEGGNQKSEEGLK